jgi:hypothetical protein
MSVSVYLVGILVAVELGQLWYRDLIWAIKEFRLRLSASRDGCAAGLLLLSLDHIAI